MNKAEVKIRIEELRKWLWDWNRSYHSGIGDAADQTSEQARDTLKRELEDLEKEWPEFFDENSPTQRVGAALDSALPPVKHLTKKKSLPDAFSLEEVSEWEERGKRLVRDLGGFFAEVKLDGLNITLHFEGGKFVKALTRGNGIEGEDVTHSIKTIQEIPLELAEKVDVEVAGEVFIPRKKFEEINEGRKKAGLELFANPRNCAAGTVRTLDPAVSAERGLQMVFYSLGENNLEEEPESQSEMTEWFAKIGLPVLDEKWRRKCADLKCVERFFLEMEERRDEIPFDIDGLVIKIDERKIQELMGHTAKTPRWAVAWKFPAEEAATKVEAIEVQVGRTGALTPVAILQPVLLAGSTVSRATLHNQDEVKRKDVRIGDTVVVRKAGDIIPEVVRVLKELRPENSEEFEWPKKCPLCGGKIERPEGEKIWRCVNEECFEVMRRKLKHFAGKNAVDIDGLGEKVIDQLLEKELVSDVADFFSLKEGDLMDLELVKEKKAGKLVKAIFEARKMPIAKLLFGLGIRFLGEKTALDLANWMGRHLPTPLNDEKFLKWVQIVSVEELEEIEGIGGKVANEFVKFWGEEKNVELMKKLFENGVRIDFEMGEIGEKLGGKSFVLTGTLENLSRAVAKDLILKNGGSVSSGVSAKTDFVVAGKEAGSKLKKAGELGVAVIDEEEFVKMIS